MFDTIRLFKVLYHLSDEKNNFLLAQDAVEALKGCITQIKDVDLVLTQMESKREENPDLVEYQQQIDDCVSKLMDLKSDSANYLELLYPLLNLAGLLSHLYLC
jgi:hypothetical protein